MRTVAFVLALALLSPLMVFAQTSPESPDDPVPQPAATIVPGQAPADEYFGRLGYSILEIRNRLTVMEHETDTAFLADDNALDRLNDLQDAIADWHREYPDDQWIPEMLSRLFKLYVRADEPTNPHAIRALGLLLTNYPDYAVSRDALLAMEKQPNQAQSWTVSTSTASSPH